MQAEEVSHTLSFVAEIIICLHLFSLSECKSLSYVSSMLKIINLLQRSRFPQLQGYSCSVNVHNHKDILNEILEDKVVCNELLDKFSSGIKKQTNKQTEPNPHFPAFVSFK